MPSLTCYMMRNVRIGICFISIAFFHRCAVDTNNDIAIEHYTDTILTPTQLLGKKIFFDKNFSNPAGQSCASCHMPNRGFADADSLPVSKGILHASFGHRNAPSISYLAFTPNFYFDSVEQTYVGGFFWDGSAKTLSEQAMNPLLNHIEMNNSDKKMVVSHIKNSEYKDLFLYAFGPHSLDSIEIAFECITHAIEEFEETKEISPFTSKFDYYTRGLIDFTESEKRGLKIFNDTAKGNCAACHPSTPDKISGAILFTDFTYDNLGLPQNSCILDLCKDYKTDMGLGAIVNDSLHNGKFKVPTLRNVAATPPYFHNGIYKTLKETVEFYNERDSGKFGKAEVNSTVNKDELGNLKLTGQEVNDLIAFMQTLTDGYKITGKDKRKN